MERIVLTKIENELFVPILYENVMDNIKIY